MPDRDITPEHEKSVLIPRGITADQAVSFGVYSVEDVSTVEGFEDSRYAVGSGLIFPWQSPLSGTVLQFRPDNPQVNDSGDRVKYVFKPGQQMVLGTLHDSGDGPLLLAEGTMQSLAAAIYAPTGWNTAGMSGCWSWRTGDSHVAIPDLVIAEGRDIVIALDADAASNLAVYQAGINLAQALKMEGANTVRFLQLAGHGGTAGLDDILGSRPENKRASWLARQLCTMEEKPAPKPPKASSASSQPKLVPAGRPVIVINGDRADVINEMTRSLKDRWDSTHLFNYAGTLHWRGDATVKRVDKAVFNDLISQAALTVTQSAKGDVTPAWPDEPSRDAALSRADRFAPLQRIAQVPFVRPDGSIRQESGYDEASQTFLVLDDTMSSVAVPDEPTPEDVLQAVKLICDEWLGDLMAIMPEASDRANCLALILTPLIRGLVPLVPLAVIDGLQMGVGKNLLADLLSIFAVGKPASPLPYSREDEENRKIITSSFRAGHDLLVFDEAHQIEGRQLARAVTSITYTDRQLGVSTMLEFPNRVTWLALGNNVSVAGDLARRVYRIRLAPKVENPHDRDVAGYRHPDIKAWTVQHRSELVAAALTVVRAWFTGEQSPNAAGGRFASFEQWAGMVGGMLDNAGVDGFLGNLAEWRSETDFETSWWTDHFRWLHQQFGAAEFSTHEVVRKMKSSNGPVEHPPRLEDHDARGYSRSLGMAYGRVKGRTVNGLRLLKTADSPGHGNRWTISDGSVPGSEISAPEAPIRVDRVDRGDSSYLLQERTSLNNTYVVLPEKTPGNAGSPIPLSTRSTPMYRPAATTGADPLSSLLPLCAPVPARECPDDDRPEELTPDGFTYACRSCHPEMWD